MRKEIFNFLKARLEEMTDTPVKHVELYSAQLANLEHERPFETPAVLIKFDPIQWKMLSLGKREADLIISLYVITKAYGDHYMDALDGLELIQRINQTLHGAKDCLLGIGPMQCDSSITDDEFDELMVNIERYSMRIEDESLMSKRTLLPGPIMPVITT